MKPVKPVSRDQYETRLIITANHLKYDEEWIKLRRWYLAWKRRLCLLIATKSDLLLRLRESTEMWIWIYWIWFILRHWNGILELLPLWRHLWFILPPSLHHLIPPSFRSNRTQSPPKKTRWRRNEKNGWRKDKQRVYESDFSETKRRIFSPAQPHMASLPQAQAPPGRTGPDRTGPDRATRGVAGPPNNTGLEITRVKSGL